MPKDHMAVRILDKTAAKMAQESNGRIQLQTYPSSQLGGDVDMIMQVHSGALDFQMESGSMISNVVPVAGIVSVGFAFKDLRTGVEGDGRRTRRDRPRNPGRGRLLLPSRAMDNGFRQLTTSRRKVMSVARREPAQAPPADRAGVDIAVGEPWGGPASMDLAELYTGLQTGIVDGWRAACSRSRPSSCMRSKRTWR